MTHKINYIPIIIVNTNKNCIRIFHLVSWIDTGTVTLQNSLLLTEVNVQFRHNNHTVIFSNQLKTYINI